MIRVIIDCQMAYRISSNNNRASINRLPQSSPPILCYSQTKSMIRVIIDCQMAYRISSNNNRASINRLPQYFATLKQSQ